MQSVIKVRPVVLVGNNPSFPNLSTKSRLQVRAGLLNVLCSTGIIGKIWSSCSQHEIQYTELKMSKCTYNQTRQALYV